MLRYIKMIECKSNIKFSKMLHMKHTYKRDILLYKTFLKIVIQQINRFDTNNYI